MAVEYGYLRFIIGLEFAAPRTPVVSRVVDLCPLCRAEFVRWPDGPSVQHVCEQDDWPRMKHRIARAPEAACGHSGTHESARGPELVVVDALRNEWLRENRWKPGPDTPTECECDHHMDCACPDGNWDNATEWYAWAAAFVRHWWLFAPLTQAPRPAPSMGVEDSAGQPSRSRQATHTTERPAVERSDKNSLTTL